MKKHIAVAALLVSMFLISANAQYVQTYSRSFERIADASADILIAGTSDLLGAYTLDGDELIPCIFHDIKLEDDWLLVTGQSGTGVYAYERQLLPPIYADIFINKKYALVCDNDSSYGLYSLYDEKWIFPPQPDLRCDLELQTVMLDHKVYSFDGIVLVECSDGFDAVLYPDAIRFEANGKYGVRRYDGTILIEPQYAQINSLSASPGYAVTQNGKLGLLNADGSEWVSCSYDGYREFTEGLLLYQDANDSKTYFTTGGTCIARNMTDLVDWCGNAIEFQKKDGTLGVISVDGDEILPFHFSQDNSAAQRDECMILYGDSFAAVTNQAKTIVPPGRYAYLAFPSRGSDSIWCYDENNQLLAIFDSDGKKHAINQNIRAATAYWSIAYWKDLGLFSCQGQLYTIDGVCVLDTDEIFVPSSAKNLLCYRQDGLWRLAGLSAYHAFPSAWAISEIEGAVNSGIVPVALQTGWTMPITREGFCCLAIQTLEQCKAVSIPKPAATTFTDVVSEKVEQARALGIVGGVGDNHFEPERAITREEAAKMLWNTAQVMGYSVGNAPIIFSDRQGFSTWAVDAISAITTVPSDATPAMKGTGNSQFSPKETYTREQAIASFYRLYSGV